MQAPVRRTVFPLLASLCAAALAPAARADDAAARQQVLSLWSQYKAAWNARDAAGVGAALAAGGCFQIATMPAAVQGGEAAAQAAAATFAAFPDFQVESPQPEFLDDRRMVEKWTLSGTWTQPFIAGPFAGLKPTGRRFTVQGVSLYEWDNGKLRSYENYFNVLAVMAQIGALPMPGPRP